MAATNGTKMKPIAAVELPDLRMPITETTVAASPPASPVHSAHGASGRELNFTDMVNGIKTEVERRK